jgi:hypothetical protein
MHGLKSLWSVDFDGATKRCEVCTPGDRRWVTQDNGVGTLTDQIEIDIKANSVGAHVIQSGIHHAAGE